MPTFHYQIQEETQAVQIKPNADGYQVTIGDSVYQIKLHQQDEHTSQFTVNGQRRRVHLAQDRKSDERRIWFAGQSWQLNKIDPRRKDRRASSQAEAGALTASMPGQVQAVLAKKGMTVKQGDTLLIVEAMKMETRIIAPQDGTVVSIGCAVGDIVERGQTLVVLAE